MNNMNNVFRVVRNESTGVWVAVSEFAKRSGKTNRTSYAGRLCDDAGCFRIDTKLCYVVARRNGVDPPGRECLSITNLWHWRKSDNAFK
ncbi:hypothetical protein CRI63_24165 [Escherichia sp. E2661]|nr:hypothetical protein CRI63_24165 [Escherichia sp. E2661]